jgi:hypothetical protein
MLVLWDWNKLGKIPILGPQTSVLPINQSSWYFYLLYPGFLLSNAQPISANYTLAGFYIASFIAGLYWFKREEKMQILLLMSFFLVSIHPQFITQNRTVSNPSFVGLFLIISIITFVKWLQESKLQFLFVYAFAMALAVSFSYSAAPVLLSTIIYLVFTKRKHLLNAVGIIVISLSLVNLTTIAFEIKHKFLISRNLFERGIRIQPIENISLNSRFSNIVNYGFSLGSNEINLLAFLLMTTVVVFVLYSKRISLLSKQLGLLWLLTMLFSIVLPTQIFPHYIFGMITLVFLFVSSLPLKASFPLIGVMALIYLNPTQITSYFTPSARTVGQMESCFEKVCRDYKEPIYATVQANFHTYHYGPEHRFIMKKKGCDVRNIEEPSQNASYMAVVMDGSDFEVGKTSYGELTIFGKAFEVKRYNCQKNFGVAILKR